MSEITNPPNHFEIHNGYASFRPTGDASLEKAVRLVSEAIAYAHDNDVQRLLVDMVQVTGFPPPGITERYYIMHEWGAKARRRVKVAMLTRQEMVERRKFGVLVSSNIGFEADVFTSESEALAWLLDERRKLKKE